ncbi:MAG: NADH-ubiquinone oxidoreductase-F iron-sulfur binding region domain-containing protein [Acidimicrobiales bacterium]
MASLPDYRQAGGLEGLRRAKALGPDATIDLIGNAGIRGRGGAGFPTGRKWRGIRDSLGNRGGRFVVVNGAEGEPGTFKDRALLRANPYLVIEGALVAAATLAAARIVIATKASYRRELEAITSAVGQLDAGGHTDGVEITVVEGPDHYLYGEETAMLEVIEGEDPLPRHLPPYQYGLFTTSPQLGWSAGAGPSADGVDPVDPYPDQTDNPVLVNNVETYAHVALVCRNGADWYRSMGTGQSPGPTIVTISGDVARAVVAEIELGQPLDQVIDELSGGPSPGRMIKAVLSGVSNPALTADKLDAPISHEHLIEAGGGLGSAGFIVYDDTRNMVDVAYQVARFLHVESCGQCNPCKTGTGDITTALEGLVMAAGEPGAHLTTIERRLTTVTDASRCYLPTQAKHLIASLLRLYPDDLAERLAGRPGDPDVVLPKLVDLADGVAVIDPGQSLKRPDWTYGETTVRFSDGIDR